MAEKVFAGMNAIVFEDQETWLELLREYARRSGLEIVAEVPTYEEVVAALKDNKHRLRTLQRIPDLAIIGGALFLSGSWDSEEQARGELELATLINPRIVTIGVSGSPLPFLAKGLDFDPGKDEFSKLDLARVAELIRARSN